MDQAVLVLTYEGDAHAERLSVELSSLGVRAISIPRGNINEFRFESDGESLLLSGAGLETLDAREFRAVFLRCMPRSSDFGTEDGKSDLELESYIGVQKESIFYDWLHTLSLHVPFYNPIAETSRSAGKIYQRSLARAIGLTCPEEYAGDHPGRALTFARKIWNQGREVCTKAFANKNLVIDGQRLTRYTEKLDPAAAGDLTDLAGCPLIFQGYLEKAYELRVNVVGAHVLACRIDSQKAGGATAVDWRRYNLPRTPHARYDLPREVAQKLLAFHGATGLKHSAFDLIRTLAGDYVFLETNAFGQWLWIEDLTGMPITATVAAVLAGKN